MKKRLIFFSLKRFLYFFPWSQYTAIVSGYSFSLSHQWCELSDNFRRLLSEVKFQIWFNRFLQKKIITMSSEKMFLFLRRIKCYFHYKLMPVHNVTYTCRCFYSVQWWGLCIQMRVWVKLSYVEPSYLECTDISNLFFGPDRLTIQMHIYLPAYIEFLFLGLGRTLTVL